MIKSLDEIVADQYSESDIASYSLMHKCTIDQAVDRLKWIESQKEPPELKKMRLIFRKMELEFRYWKELKCSGSVNLITFQGIPILERNTINVVMAATGMHKSRYAHCLASLLLSSTRSLPQLQMEYASESEPVVVLVDSEHSEPQLVNVRSRISVMANGSVSPSDNFEIINIKGDIDKLEKLRQIFIYLELRYPGRMKFVVIDTITDLIGDINNLDNSMELIELLNSKLDSSNFTFLCLIHEVYANGRVKPRGHTGTEIHNKASTTMRLSKAGKNNYKIEFIKWRSGLAPVPIVVTHCDVTEGLRLASPDVVDSADQSKPGPKTLFTEEALLEHLRCLLSGPMTKKQLVAELMLKFNCGDRTIINRLKGLTTVRIDSTAYRLCQDRKNGVKFWLEPD